MPVRRDKRGQWIYRKQFKLPNGEKVRIFGTPTVNTKEAAEQAERIGIDRALHPERYLQPVQNKEVPTFEQWFWGDDASAEEPAGRFWKEWVVANKNKPSEVEAKKSIYKHHLGPAFGKLPLDTIGVSAVAQFRASLVEKKVKRQGEESRLSEKRINNILTVLSKALRYAAEVEVIARAPRVGLFNIDRPEIEYWEFDQYARIVKAAQAESPEWYTAVCLAGEAGLRVGEIKALKWQEHVDLVAGTLTISEQTRHGVTGTPKGGRRRVVPMTATLLKAIKALSVVRVGYVVRNLDGTAITDGQATHAIRRIIRRAGLPERGWHSLRHSFGTHSALLSVNPWRLQAWMGHRRIDETMLYVHLAGAHTRPTPPVILGAAGAETDPDRRVLAMLGARAGLPVERVAEGVSDSGRGSHVAANEEIVSA